jgi:hypothetical protein
MSEEDILNDFQGRQAELSKLIRSWNLVESTAVGEFDKLAERILRLLYEGEENGAIIERIISISIL